MPTQLSPQDIARAKATYDRWEADRNETWRAGAMRREVREIDDFYQIHDGINVKVMWCALASIALEKLEEFCGNVAELVAAGKDDAEIAAVARRVAGEFIAAHQEAIAGVQ